jgi:hypothetical protein
VKAGIFNAGAMITMPMASARSPDLEEGRQIVARRQQQTGSTEAIAP